MIFTITPEPGMLADCGPEIEFKTVINGRPVDCRLRGGLFTIEHHGGTSCKDVFTFTKATFDSEARTIAIDGVNATDMRMNFEVDDSPLFSITV